VHRRRRRHAERLRVLGGRGTIDGIDRPDTCFGYRVGSEVPLRYLRRGGALDESAPLVVRATREPDPGPEGALLREWLPTELNPFHARLFVEDDRYRFWVDGAGSYRVDPANATIEVPAEGDPLQREERMWGIPAVLCFQHRGDHSVHAASIGIGGRALLFAAPGRFGKTTLATAFHGAGYDLLAEDSSCVRFEPEPVALPGPAMLRVRPDSYERLGVPDAEVLAARPDRVHLAIHEDRRASGDPRALSGIVLLRRAEEGVRVERVPPEAAIQELWNVSLGVPTDEDRALRFERVARLAAAVPVWNLHRPLAYELLPDVIEAVVASCLP